MAKTGAIGQTDVHEAQQGFQAFVGTGMLRYYVFFWTSHLLYLLVPVCQLQICTVDVLSTPLDAAGSRSLSRLDFL